MTTYNEKRFKTVLKITNIATFILNLFIYLGLIVGTIGFVVLLFVSADQLTFQFSEFPRFAEMLPEFAIELPEQFLDRQIALRTPGLLIALATVITSLLSAVLIRYVRQILKDVTNEEPFSAENVKRLFYISYTILVTSIISPLLFSLVTWSFTRQFDMIHDGFRFNINLMLVLFAAFIYILAHVFSYGVYLQSEVDGTV